MSAIASLLPKALVFAVSAALSALVASVAVTAMHATGPVSDVREAPQYLLRGPDTPAGPGVPVAFSEEPGGEPQVIAGLAPKDLAAAAQALLGGTPVVFKNPVGFPRVTPITQFDGGPLQGANCTLASGAMLARLAYGIVTDGSTLRTLQDDQVGGTGIDDLATALWRGYGVSPAHGLIRTETLRKLLAAGYGAVVQGDYGRVPVGLRLEKSFAGGHAVYLDGYYPGSPRQGIPAAYYVIDPIGRPAFGYQGDWWPASVVEDFVLSWGGGRAAAMWAFPPGGSPPDVVGPDVLPIPAETGGGSGATPAPGATGAVLSPGDAGSDIVVLPPEAPPVGGVFTHSGHLDAHFDICLFDPTLAGCPPGVEGVFDRGLPPILHLPPGPEVKIVFVDSDRPDVALVGFTVEPPAPATVKFWPASGTPAVVGTPTSMMSLTLTGTPVTIARLDVAPGTEYQFQAVAGDGLLAATSPIGSFTTGGGLSAFDVSLSPVASPAIRLTSGLSPYRHLAPGAFAPPMVRLSALGGSPCEADASFGGVAYCLDLGASAAPIASCTRASVSYALTGLDASGVVARAFPAEAGSSGGAMTLDGVLEASGPAPSGTLELGCLTPGMSYTVVLDALGDARGILAARTIAVP